VVIGVTRHTPGPAHVLPTTTIPPTATTPLAVESISPSPKSIGVAATTPITIAFSAPVRRGSPMPTLHPAIAGSWSRPAATELRFTPTGLVLPLTQVTVTIPDGAAGPTSTTHQVLASPVTWSYTVAPGSTLRLQQLLAELDYLPVAFVAPSGNSGTATATGPGTNAGVPSTSGASEPSGANTAPTSATNAAPAVPASSAAALDAEPTDPSSISLAPLPGTLVWRFGSIPAQLRATFTAGESGVATLGAVIGFEAEHHLALDGAAGPAVWSALLDAVANRQPTSRPYDYVLVTETEPETLYVWQEGKVILQTPINTGVSGAATPTGTWPVYLRFTSTTMTGVNPDGTHYSDPGVPWVSYFNGSDAVHGFPRAGYGYPQSDGCVEVPISTAAAVYPLDPYGTLVTLTSGNLAGELGVAQPHFILPPTTTTTVPNTTTTSTTTTTAPPVKRRTPPTTTSPVPPTSVPTPTVAPTG